MWRFIFPLAAALAWPCLGAELEVKYSAMERLMSEQLFTQEGRRYVKGSQAARCQYAYLESPRIGTENGKILVTARFSGRSAFDLLGHCMGLGDSFGLKITASPAAHGGAIVLDDVKVATDKDSYYVRRVREELEKSFAKEFTIDVKAQAHRLLEAAGWPGFQQEMSSFDLSAVRVTSDSLVLVVEFTLVVK